MRAVHVIWIDSETDTGWEEFEERALGFAHTVGFLIAETENYVVIANSYDPATNECNGRISIPLCAIKEMNTLCRIKI